MRTCTKCKTNKEQKDFHRSCKYADGFRRICIECYKSYHKNRMETDPIYKINRRNDRLKRSFGIDVDAYNKLFFEQKGCCAICLRHQKEFKRSLAVDHDHITKEVRGLLCFDCNSGIGKLQDNTNIIDAASVYLKRSKLKIAGVN